MSASPPLEFKITDDVPVYEISDKVSKEGNIMTAAIISILVVILFVSFLHIYAKYVLLRHRQPQNRSIPAPQQLGDRNFRSSGAIDANRAASPAKGLEPSAISLIPIFVYKDSGSTDEVVGECAICLSVFEADELCRKLPGCGHVFHVECIDMWFHSHSTCPICRSCPVSSENGKVVGTTMLPEVRLEVRIDIGDDQACNTEPSSSSSTTSESSESVRRAMSRNRSERKIHPSEALQIVTT